MHMGGVGVEHRDPVWRLSAVLYVDIGNTYIETAERRIWGRILYAEGDVEKLFNGVRRCIGCRLQPIGVRCECIEGICQNESLLTEGNAGYLFDVRCRGARR